MPSWSYSRAKPAASFFAQAQRVQGRRELLRADQVQGGAVVLGLLALVRLRDSLLRRGRSCPSAVRRRSTTAGSGSSSRRSPNRSGRPLRRRSRRTGCCAAGARGSSRTSSTTAMHAGRARAVVVGAGVQAAAHAEVVEVAADHHVFVLQLRVAAGQDADHVAGRCRSSETATTMLASSAVRRRAPAHPVRAPCLRARRGRARHRDPCRRRSRPLGSSREPRAAQLPPAGPALPCIGTGQSPRAARGPPARCCPAARASSGTDSWRGRGVAARPGRRRRRRAAAARRRSCRRGRHRRSRRRRSSSRGRLALAVSSDLVIAPTAARPAP